jgi:LysR family transcriptional regulator, nitrogen assimilation regulatory protein
MELRRLRYLVKVVDAGGFRRASEMLNVAQPALTRQVQALEAEFGVPLLFRSAAGVTPTPQGEIVLREAREIIARSLDRAQAAGEVRLGLPPALADLIFGTVVQRVSAKHPDVHLVCREGAAGLVEEVENGSLDLAIVSVTSTRSSYRCHLTPLVKEQDYLVSRRDGDPGGASISIDEVLLMPLVLTPLPNARRQYLDRLAHKRGVKLKVVTEAASSSAQLNLVLRGLGSAVLPFSAAQLMSRDRRVKIVPIKGLQSHRVMLTSVKGRNPVGADKVSREIRGVFSARIWDNLLSKPI